MPDGNFFEAVKAGRASVATGRIERIEKDGVRLKSGKLVPADAIVTATGLRLTLGGKIAVSLDGERIDFSQRWFYRGCMFSNVPNLAVVFGYLNASWTLRADNTAEYVCRVLNHMADKRAAVVRPFLPKDHGLEEDDIVVFSSSYLERARPLIPKSAAELPWRLNQDYFEDCKDLRRRPIDDGVLSFEPFETLGLRPRSSGRTENSFPSSVLPEEGSKPVLSAAAGGGEGPQAASPSRRTQTA